MSGTGTQPQWPGAQDPARGLNPTRPISGYDMVALMRLLADKAHASIARGSVDPLMDFIFSSLATGSGFVAHIPTACGKGCNYCCHLWVDATPAEVLYAVRKIAPPRREATTASVEKAHALTSGVSFADRCGKVNPPCPMLDDRGACGIYEARPISCRTLVSTDAEECRRALAEGAEESFPSLKVWFTLRDSYSTALEGALMHAGLAHQAHEWNDSLKIALAQPDAEQRWLSGADVFASAARTPAAPIFQHPTWREIYRQAFGALPHG